MEFWLGHAVSEIWSCEFAFICIDSWYLICGLRPRLAGPLVIIDWPLLSLAGPLSSLDGPLVIVGHPFHRWLAPHDTGQDCRRIFVQLAKSSQLTETTFERGLTSGLWWHPCRVDRPLLSLAGPLSSLDGLLAIIGRPPRCWLAPLDTGQDSCHDCRRIFVQLAKSSQLTETTFERGLTSGLWRCPHQILLPGLAGPLVIVDQSLLSLAVLLSSLDGTLAIVGLDLRQQPCQILFCRFFSALELPRRRATEHYEATHVALFLKLGEAEAIYISELKWAAWTVWSVWSIIYMVWKN